MGSTDNTYNFEHKNSASGTRYLFISAGRTDVVKAVDIAPVGKIDERVVYNFGFGDYDMDQNTVSDSINTNNGDPYRVFNTILNTIRHFFERYTDAILMVRGSDSRPGFAEHCRLTCSKKCKDICKHEDRRMSIYRNYLNKNYNELSVHYQFLGGYFSLDDLLTIEEYIPQKKYNAVFLSKIKV